MRMRTLPVAFVAVLTGAALAWKHQSFDLLPTIAALICAILIQIATNFANDYYDFQNGADRADRVGFKRASSSGEIPPQNMLYASIVTFSASFLLGLYLVFHAGWPILIIGLAAITAGFLYTAGPFPLAYHGMGEIFTFLFFGIIAVMGSYYVNTLQWSLDAFFASLPAGALSATILVVNNYRDIHTDRIAGKNTLAVLLGEQFSRWQFLTLILFSFFIPILFYLHLDYGASVLLPYLLLPWAFFLIRHFWTESEKKVFNAILVRTALFMLSFGSLFILGILGA